MKKLIGILTSLTLLAGVLAMPVSAETMEQPTGQTIIEKCDDGSYFVTEIVEEPTTRATKTKTGTKSTTYYNANDVKQFKFDLKGTFTYTGTSAKCTKATATVTTYNGSSVLSKKAYPSGASAYGSTTVQFKNIRTSKSLRLTCSAKGVLS